MAKKKKTNLITIKKAAKLTGMHHSTMKKFLINNNVPMFKGENKGKYEKLYINPYILADALEKNGNEIPQELKVIKQNYESREFS